MKKIKLDSIRIDGDTQSRMVVDQPTVYNYLENMKEGDEFPRMFVVYDGSTYWLVDGFHRYHAYKLMGLKEITINYKPGTWHHSFVAKNEGDAFLIVERFGPGANCDFAHLEQPITVVD